jgi:putative FmdB family regulatory protein
MPTYEYVCAKCGSNFELVQSIKAPALTVCPKESCPRKPWGKGSVKRAVGGGAGLIFKGSGFYITDYRSDKYKAAAKKDAGGTAPAAGKKEGASPAASSTGGSSTPSTPAPAPKPKTD